MPPPDLDDAPDGGTETLAGTGRRRPAGATEAGDGIDVPDSSTETDELPDLEDTDLDGLDEPALSPGEEAPDAPEPFETDSGEQLDELPDMQDDEPDELADEDLPDEGAAEAADLPDAGPDDAQDISELSDLDMGKCGQRRRNAA